MLSKLNIFVKPPDSFCPCLCLCVSVRYSVLRQNAELAKLRQECTKLTKDLGEKTGSLLADEHLKKGLEAKVSATEKQLSLMQVGLAFAYTTLNVIINYTGCEITLPHGNKCIHLSFLNVVSDR